MDLDTLLAERECARLLVRLVQHLDLGTPSDAAGLFTPDGVWEWPGGDRVIRGRAELADYFGSRPADRLSRRLTTNVLVTVTGRDDAHATSYFATYRVDGWDGSLVPPPPVTQVGHYDDVFRRVDGTWLLARRTLRLAFGGATPRASGA